MEETRPKASIIVPNFNHSKFLEKRLDSLFNQTYQNFEIILLDDASTDQSLNIISLFSSHPKVYRIIVNSNNTGLPFSQWDKGIRCARGDLIWIAESDDWADFEFLETLLPLFADNNIALAYCASYNVDENDNILEVNEWNNVIDQYHWKNDYYADGNFEIKNYLIYKNTIFNASSVIFRKDLYLNVNHNINLKYFGDWLLWVLLIRDKKIAYSAKRLNYFRTHSNTTRSTKTFSEEINRIKESEYVINKIIQSNNIRINFFHLLRWNWIFSKFVKNRTLFYKNLLFYFPPIDRKSLYLIFYCKLFYTMVKDFLNVFFRYF